MSKYSAKLKARPARRQKTTTPPVRTGTAPAHAPLANNLVYVFVDDQNLFYGIVNDERGPGYRFDFGRLLLAAARDSQGRARGVKHAYVAGVIPDDDSFWKIAQDLGFTVRRGYLGSKGRSKQDDAWLITDLTATVCEQPGPWRRAGAWRCYSWVAGSRWRSRPWPTSCADSRPATSSCMGKETWTDDGGADQ